MSRRSPTSSRKLLVGQDEAVRLALDEQGQRVERQAAVRTVAHQLAEGDRGAAEQGMMRRRGIAGRQMQAGDRRRQALVDALQTFDQRQAPASSRSCSAWRKRASNGVVSTAMLSWATIWLGTMAKSA